METFNVIGAGLAGSEAALRLARAGRRVRLFEQKPQKFSSAHKLPGAAELVCSNSLKSLELNSAHGLLKQELKTLGSPLLEIAEICRVPGGKALAVEREKFSQAVTTAIENEPLIEWIREEATELPSEGPTLVATGPLTSSALIEKIRNVLEDQGLYFYDATAPVISLESLDLSHFFWGNRNQEGGDYLNLPLTQAQYLSFRELILGAEKMPAHLPEEELKFFEGCLPIEVLAERGEQTLSCSCMNPSGFREKAPAGTYAIIQFRREQAAGELLSMVGFQTRMKWPEQERVFRTLPGMANAEFVRLGAMHRNTYLNAPRHLTERLECKLKPQLFFAGQITGSEGYSEAIATGHYAALMMLGASVPPETTALRSLVRYLNLSDAKYFQPMNVNFGLLPPLENFRAKMKRGARKQARQAALAERALRDLEEWIARENSICSLVSDRGVKAS